MRGNAVKHETAQLSRGRLGQDLGQQIGKHLLGWHIGELDLAMVHQLPDIMVAVVNWQVNGREREICVQVQRLVWFNVCLMNEANTRNTHTTMNSRGMQTTRVGQSKLCG